MADQVTGRRVVDARCPLRFDEPCTLCHPEATGPQDCPTVGIVMDDEDLRAELARRRLASRNRASDPGRSDPG